MIAFEKKDYKEAKKYLEKSCINDVNACVILAQIYLGDRTTGDLTNPLEYLHMASKQNHLFASATLGSLYLDKNNTIYDYGKGIDFLNISCKNGFGAACTLLALNKTDIREVLPLLRKGCEYGFSKGCGILGNLKIYENKDYLEEVCEEDNYSECEVLGNQAYDKRNWEKTKYYYEKSCSGGNAIACAFLGGMYGLHDIKIENGDAAANMVLKQACEKGATHGCNLLGARYEYGIGVLEDTNKAKQLYKRSCFLNDADGCKEYINLI